MLRIKVIRIFFLFWPRWIIQNKNEDLKLSSSSLVFDSLKGSSNLCIFYLSTHFGQAEFIFKTNHKKSTMKSLIAQKTVNKRSNFKLKFVWIKNSFNNRTILQQQQQQQQNINYINQTTNANVYSPLKTLLKYLFLFDLSCSRLSDNEISSFLF